MPRPDVLSLPTALVFLFSSGVAIAQETAKPAAQPATEERAQEIVVTGTRIRRKDPTTPAPVSVISRDQIAASGKVSIGDFLQGLPEQGNAINTGVNAGGDGSTRVNLRGIGTSRTLVLVNGRRWMPGGAGADGSVDLNSIPSAAVERIEVLKGGASGVYGSDAIAGVVNIITRRSGEKTDVSLFTGTSGHGDGTTFDLNLTSGTGNDRGNLLFSAGYYDQRKVMAGDRAFSKFAWYYDATAGRYSQGSGTIPAGRTLSFGQGGAGNALWNTLQATGAGSYIWEANPANATACGTSVSGQTSCFRPYLGAGLPEAGDVTGGDGYNTAAESYLVTPQQRIQLFSTGDLKLGSVARAFFEASYVNRQSGQELAPEPLVSVGEGVVTSAANIYNPFDKNVYVNRRLTEFGNRQTRQHINTFRVLGGVDGTASDSLGPLAGWFWDVNLSWGRTAATSQKTGSLYLPALSAALGPSMLVNGTPTCVSTPGDASTAIPGCVPLNLFGGPGSITPDQVAGLTFTGTSRGYNQLWSVQANTSGELFRLMSDRPVGIAVGYEYRDLSGAFINDSITTAGLTTGATGHDTRGSYDVNELYGELSIPLVRGIPFAENLEATVAARWFDYSTFGGDTTYKLGARWRPVSDVTVRGTYSTAFRAPTIQESYGAQVQNFPVLRDPCRGPAAGGPALSPACLAAGVPAAGSGDVSTHFHAIVGGNPDVGPETAIVYTVGVVLEPRWVRNLSVSVDYHSMEIDGTIGSYGESVLLTGCYSGTNPEHCSHVVRNPTTHFIDTIYNLNANVGKLATAGLDFAVRYALPTPSAGRFAFALDATWLREIDLTLADGTVVKGKNTFDLNTLNSLGGAGGSFPAWKANVGLTWGLGGLGAGISTRFLGSFHECGDSTGDFSGSGLCYVDSTYQRKVESYHTEDAFVSYTLGSSVGKTNVMVGVQNLSNAPPALIYNGLASSTDQYNYDQMGRFFYVRLAQTY